MADPPAPTIDLLLNLIDTRPASILTSLASHPQLASASDAHGYTLVHASVSYAQLDVLRTLIQTYNVNPNILDEDGETPLFAAETQEVAKCLVEELGADTSIRNSEGKTAEEKFLEEEGQDHEVYQYLRNLRGGNVTQPEAINSNGETNGVLPNGARVEVGTMPEDAAGEAPDPEIRRRIEELAARDDFQTEEGQRQLRSLVEEVVSGISSDTDMGRSTRRRVDH